MGAGKSSLGKALSKRIHWSFTDLDEEIATKLGMTIPEIFLTKGEQFFREQETKALHSLGARQNIVVSTGGGTPCYNNNMHLMHQLGRTVFLDVPAKTLALRLQREIDHRPVLLEAIRNGHSLESFVAQKLKSRMPFYHQSDFVVSADKPVVVLVEELYKILQKVA